MEQDGMNKLDRYASKGDKYNAIVLTLSLAYAGCIVYFTRPGRGFLDDEWKRDGFCIKNKDVPYWSSFDTCFYVDTIFSTILGILWFCWRNYPGMQQSSSMAPFVMMGTFGHGFAHAAMAAKWRRGDVDSEAEDDKPGLVQLALVVAIFWFPLLKASLMKVNTAVVLILATGVAHVQANAVDEVFGFAYVQTILSVAYHCSQLMLPQSEKHCREYMLLPLAVALPSVMVSWMEALFCSEFFRSLGGHVLYDASIIIPYVFYYCSCFVHARGMERSKAKLD